MKKMLALLGSVTALALAPAAANAATFPIAPNVAGDPNFYITQTDSSGDITAFLGDSFSGANVAFDDFFTFSVNVDGLGSGGVVTSFGSDKLLLTITSVKINGVLYPSTPTGASVSNVFIPKDVLNVIEITGVTGPHAKLSNFGGQATFTPTVPEPATWAMFLAGFGFMGFAARRKLSAQLKTA